MRNLVLILFLFLVSFASGQVGTSLEIYAEHDGVVGSTDLTGYTTYRLYITLPSDSDVVYMMWGDDDFPLEINSDSVFYQDPFGGATSGNINPTFFTLIPELQYDSFLGIGPADNNFPQPLAIEGSDPWITLFEAGNNLYMTDTVGGAIFQKAYYDGDMLLPVDNKLFVGQFTTKGNLWGIVNVDYFENFEINQDYSDPSAALGLEFGSPSGLVLGCTDPVALNYSSTANVLTNCQYVLGDLTFDGEVGVDDLLILLGGFGCMEDCGNIDLNGDGIVNMLDLLMFLGLL